jgi:hypothetical protein
MSKSQSANGSGVASTVTVVNPSETRKGWEIYPRDVRPLRTGKIHMANRL